MQEIDLSLDATSDRNAEVVPETTRAGDEVTMATNSYVIDGTSEDDVFTMADIEGSGESHTVLMGSNGDDVFNVGGGAVVFGQLGDDLIIANLNEAYLQDLPPEMSTTLNYDTFDGLELYGEENEYAPFSAALNVDLLDENDVVVINLDDDIEGFVHQVQFTLAQPVTITNWVIDETTIRDDIVFNEYIAYVRTDSAEMPVLTGPEITALDDDLLAVIRVGSEFVPPEDTVGQMSLFERVAEFFGVNTDPQISVNRAISTVQTIV